MSRQHRRRSWSNQQLDDILRALPFHASLGVICLFLSRPIPPVLPQACLWRSSLAVPRKKEACEFAHRSLYSFIHEATPGNRLGSLVACCEQTAKKTPGICNFGLTSGNVEDERAVTAQARSTLAAAPAPAVCTLGVVRPRNECKKMNAENTITKSTTIVQHKLVHKSADTHTNNRRGYD